MLRASNHRTRVTPPVAGPPEEGASMLLALVLIFTIFAILTGVLSLAFTAARTVES